MTNIILVLTLVLGTITIGAVPSAPSGGIPNPVPPPAVSDNAHVSR